MYVCCSCCHIIFSSPSPDSPQRPNSAEPTSFSVPMASVYPRPSSATVTKTAQMALTRLPAPSPPASPGPSSATTQCVYPPCGAAMATQTVPMGLTSGLQTVRDSSRRRRCAAARTSSSVLMANASTAAGNVMGTLTARIDRTSWTAVSIFSQFFFHFTHKFLTHSQHRYQWHKINSKLCLVNFSSLSVISFFFSLLSPALFWPISFSRSPYLSPRWVPVSRWYLYPWQPPVWQCARLQGPQWRDGLPHRWLLLKSCLTSSSHLCTEFFLLCTAVSYNDIVLKFILSSPQKLNVKVHPSSSVTAGSVSA